MKAFQSTPLDVNRLEVSGITASGKILYRYGVSDSVYDYVEIEYTSDSVTLDVYEDTRHDTIEFLDNGVSVNNVFYSYLPNISTDSVTRARTSTYDSVPPAGYTTGSYSFSHSVEKNRFELAKKVASYTTAGLCAIIAAKFFPGAVSTPSGATLYSLLANGISSLIQDAIDIACSNTYLSYKIDYYEHENSYSLDRVYRCNAYYYNALDCDSKSYAGTSNYYYHNYFT